MVEASSPGQDKAPPMVVTKSSKRAMDISKELKSLNANLFGTYWDPHTFEAKERLGASAMAQLPYIECGKDGDNSQLDLCKEKGVRVVPTWSVDGKLYPGDQDLDELEEIIAQAKNPAPAGTKVEIASAEQGAKPAPAAISTSLIWNVKSFGRPRSFGLSDIDDCVLAMQIGRCSKSRSETRLRSLIACAEYSISAAP